MRERFEEVSLLERILLVGILSISCLVLLLAWSVHVG